MPGAKVHFSMVPHAEGRVQGTKLDLNDGSLPFHRRTNG